MNWKRYMKLIFIIASIAALLGIILMICGWTMGAKDGFAITKNGFQLIDRHAVPSPSQSPNTPAAPEQNIDSFHSVKLQIGDRNLTFVKSNSYGISIDSPYDGQSAFQVINGVLTNRNNGERFSWQLPNASVNQQTITIFYPDNADFRTIEIDADGGNIQLSEIIANHISIEQDYGKIDLSDLSTNQLSVESDSGNITATGLLEGKVEIESDAGDIIIHATQTEDAYQYNCQSESGEIMINGTGAGHRIVHGNNRENRWDIQSEHGTITLDFAR